MKVLDKQTVLEIKCTYAEMRAIELYFTNHFVLNDRELLDDFVDFLVKYGQFNLAEFLINHNDATVKYFIFIP